MYMYIQMRGNAVLLLPKIRIFGKFPVCFEERLVYVEYIFRMWTWRNISEAFIQIYLVISKTT
jgi:hypothetical protein